MSDVTVKDSNGTVLEDGDSVTLIKDLKVKGTSETLKRGTLVKNIRLTTQPGEIECNTKKVKGLVLKTEFLKTQAAYLARAAPHASQRGRRVRRFPPP